MAHRDFLVALSKAKYYPSFKQYGGYFTPTEIVELVAAGAQCRKQDAEYAKDKQSTGNAGSTWFYFTASGDLKKALDENITRN